MVDFSNLLENTCLKNMNKLIFAHLDINSIRYKLDSLGAIVNNNIEVFIILETKTDSLF